MTSELRTGAAIICDALVAHEVDVVFGVVGPAVIPLYSELSLRNHRLVSLRNGQAAAHAAAGYARAGERVGVCIAGSGPGVGSLLAGMIDAQLDGTPMIVIGGQVDRPLIGTDACQETDMMGISASVTRHNFQARSAAELEEILEAAFTVASDGRRGVVYVEVPRDVFTEETATSTRHGNLTRGLLEIPAPRPEDVGAAIELIQRADRPLLLVGGGCCAGDAPAAVLALADRLHLPVASTMRAKGVLPETHPRAVGMAGRCGRKAANMALLESDLLIAVGCRFSDQLTGTIGAFAKRRVIHIDADAFELGKNVDTDVSLHTDAALGMRALINGAGDWRPTQEQRSWASRCAAAAGICLRCVPHITEEGVHPKAVMDSLNLAKRARDIVVTGVGEHQAYAAHFLLQGAPNTLIMSCGAGTAGFGLPAAIGAAIARPSSRVVLVDGDGSFQMSAPELATLAELALPIVIVVLNNGGLAWIRHEGGDPAPAGTRTPNFVSVAAAYGVPSQSADNIREFDRAFADAMDANEPRLIEARAADIPLAPIVPTGGALSEYAGNCVPAAGQLFTPAEAMILKEAAHGRQELDP